MFRLFHFTSSKYWKYFLVTIFTILGVYLRGCLRDVWEALNDDSIYVFKYFEIPDRYYPKAEIEEKYIKTWWHDHDSKRSGNGPDQQFWDLPVESVYNVSCTELAKRDSDELDISNFPFLQEQYNSYSPLASSVI